MMGRRLAGWLILSACWSCGDDGPAVRGDAGGGPDAVAPEDCDRPGGIARIAAGGLAAIAGMDASRLFFRDDEGLKTWPKAGGPATLFPRQELPVRFTLSGGRYYWWTTGTTSVVVTDERGSTLVTAELASPTNRIADVVPADGGGVYVQTRCIEQTYGHCEDASVQDTIELLAGDAPVAQPLITATRRIYSIASGADALIWLEMSYDYADDGVIWRWRPSTGMATALVEPAPGGKPAGLLAIDGQTLLFSGRGERGAPYLTLQRRSLETGALIARYSSDVPQMSTTFPHHLQLGHQLYWTEEPIMSLSAAGPCTQATGLFRLCATSGRAESIDPQAADEPILVDEERVFYMAGGVSACCSGNGQTCEETPPPLEVRCYHR
jgi:hypothetical protein